MQERSFPSERMCVTFKRRAVDTSNTDMHNTYNQNDKLFEQPELGKDEEMKQSICRYLHRWLDDRKEVVTDTFCGKAACPAELFVSAILELLQRVDCDYPVLINALCYVRRIDEQQTVPVNWLTVFRLILASTAVSIKFLRDRGLYNTHFAGLTGLVFSDVNFLERRILSALNYELYVTDMEYEQTLRELRPASPPIA
eukprot:TRINITY_DN14576_c0_g1_i1.p1 TRINITY_DN14576_c0_g1~~TRINITY_DN14576_c0_g1_i1.p1  ORF type:complete len:198 (-),score=25.51 TRINITY_DN14576_c0_g1_i1:67-660(-)